MTLILFYLMKTTICLFFLLVSLGLVISDLGDGGANFDDTIFYDVIDNFNSSGNNISETSSLTTSSSATTYVPVLTASSIKLIATSAVLNELASVPLSIASSTTPLLTNSIAESKLQVTAFTNADGTTPVTATLEDIKEHDVSKGFGIKCFWFHNDNETFDLSMLENKTTM